MRLIPKGIIQRQGFRSRMTIKLLLRDFYFRFVHHPYFLIFYWRWFYWSYPIFVFVGWVICLGSTRNIRSIFSRRRLLQCHLRYFQRDFYCKVVVLKSRWVIRVLIRILLSKNWGTVCLLLRSYNFPSDYVWSYQHLAFLRKYRVQT